MTQAQLTPLVLVDHAFWKMVEAVLLLLLEAMSIPSIKFSLVNYVQIYLSPFIFLCRRQRGQSLVDYLMSNQSRKIGPELDRENAHFSVSEAMIAAIEEVLQRR